MDTFWPSIDKLLSKEYLSPEDIGRLLRTGGSARGIQKGTFFPAITRLMDEFGMTKRDIQELVKRRATINRIQLPDFFDRIDFLKSLGFSPSLVPSMIESRFGKAFLHLTDPDPSKSSGGQYVPKHEQQMRWLVHDDPGARGLGLGADVVHNMFFVGDDSSDRARSIGKPMFRRFMEMIVERCPDSACVGVNFRRLWNVNSKFMEGDDTHFRLRVAVKEEGSLGFIIKEDDSENSVRVAEVNNAINESVQMLRPGDILVPEGGKYEDRYTNNKQFIAEATKTRRPLRFDAMTK